MLSQEFFFFSKRKKKTSSPALQSYIFPKRVGSTSSSSSHHHSTYPLTNAVSTLVIGTHRVKGAPYVALKLVTIQSNCYAKLKKIRAIKGLL